MLREVETGNLDAAVTLGPPGLEDLQDRYRVLALTGFVYRVVAPPSWGGQVRGKGWRELAQLPWIGTPPESVHHRLLSCIATAEGVDFKVVAQVDLEPSMMDLVKSGVALALAPDSLALYSAHTDGVIVADAVTVPAALGFVCRKDRRKEPAIAATMEIVAKAWHGERSAEAGYCSDPLTSAPRSTMPNRLTLILR